MRKTLTALGALLALSRPVLADDAVDAHLLAAKQAAGFEYTGTLARTCIAPAFGAGTGGPRGVIPARDTWHAEPAKMFDNLYFIGTKVHSAWALKGSDGIIIIDTLYNYAVEDEMVNGLKKLGLDPRRVKYVIISHAHGDHDEGARLFQDRYGAHVVMGAADWDGLDKAADIPGGKPKRDVVGKDGQVIRVGDAGVTLVSTPGHTPGTLSMIFTVKDHGKPVTVAYSGGTAIFAIYKNAEGLDTYIQSQRHMAELAAAAGATVLMTNHSEFDAAYTKSRLIKVREADEPHPYVVGAEGVGRYFKLLEECAQVSKAKLP
ncbi:MAG TPA: MBL fold metallo-hydrolase [Rhizomicrobium sp.]|nr:MBL fold metallo-hydrolase [Rhizomicrobium sp.]